jgi:hypothetical protein
VARVPTVLTSGSTLGCAMRASYVPVSCSYCWRIQVLTFFGTRLSARTSLVRRLGGVAAVVADGATHDRPVLLLHAHTVALAIIPLRSTPLRCGRGATGLPTDDHRVQHRSPEEAPCRALRVRLELHVCASFGPSYVVVPESWSSAPALPGLCDLDEVTDVRRRGR